ncbi:MAG TPA: hypothetical protein VIQ97_02605, partial [Prevotella sp.]
KDGDYYFFKADILSGMLTYSTDKNLAANLETISVARAKEIIDMNRKGEKPLSLLADGERKAPTQPVDLLAGADISRFDKSKKKKNNKPQDRQPRRNNNNNNRHKNNGNRGQRQQGNQPQNSNVEKKS